MELKALWALVEPIRKALGGFIHYQQNDATTPELAVTMNIPAPPSPCPPIGVEGYTGSDGPPGSLQHQAAGVYCTMVLSLRYAQSVLASPIVKWPSLSKLIASPRAGQMFNAYYDRYQLNFFYDTDPVLQKTVYTCESTDVVAHELGHAILDSLRPDLWAVQSVEIQAFHESFGDINAILTGLTFPETVRHALNETGGDLRHENVIARIAEEMGLAIWHARGNPGDRPGCALRNAINGLQYAPPETLPTRVPDDAQLAGEPHNFSRVFTGAWYDALINIYNDERRTKPPEEAILSARDRLGRVTFNGIRNAAVGVNFFSNALKAMLDYDARSNAGCGQAIASAFAAHGITPAFTPAPRAVSEALGLVGAPVADTARLADFVPSDDPLYRCVVELASGPTSRFMAEDIHGLQQAINAARHSLKVLSDYDRVSDGPSSGAFHRKEFAVIDGRLVRNYYCCGMHRHG